MPPPCVCAACLAQLTQFYTCKNIARTLVKATVSIASLSYLTLYPTHALGIVRLVFLGVFIVSITVLYELRERNSPSLRGHVQHIRLGAVVQVSSPAPASGVGTSRHTVVTTRSVCATNKTATTDHTVAPDRAREVATQARSTATTCTRPVEALLVPA